MKEYDMAYYTPDYEFESVSTTCIDTDSDENYDRMYYDMMNIIYTGIYEKEM